MSQTPSLTPSLCNSLTGCLAVSVISPLFIDRFEHSLRFCHLQLDKKAFSVVVYRRPPVNFGKKKPKSFKLSTSYLKLFSVSQTFVF